MPFYDRGYPDIENLTYLTSHDKCPVCGAPNSTCRPEDQHDVIRLAGLGAYPSLDEERGYEEQFVAGEDIWIEKQITPFSTSTVLALAKGQSMPLSKAKKLGIA